MTKCVLAVAAIVLLTFAPPTMAATNSSPATARPAVLGRVQSQVLSTDEAAYFSDWLFGQRCILKSRTTENRLPKVGPSSGFR